MRRSIISSTLRRPWQRRRHRDVATTWDVTAGSDVSATFDDSMLGTIDPDALAEEIALGVRRALEMAADAPLSTSGGEELAQQRA